MLCISTKRWLGYSLEHREYNPKLRRQSGGEDMEEKGIALRWATPAVEAVLAATGRPADPAVYSGSWTDAEAFRLLWQVYSGSWTAPARGARRQVRQLPECNPFLLHVAVHGLQRVMAKVPFPQFLSTMAEISPTTSLYLLWKCQRRQTQSLWFIISSEAHIAFGRDIRYNII
jgi:hypothetical protein